MKQDFPVGKGTKPLCVGATGFIELVYLFAYLASIVGVSIDVLLPAYGSISGEFGGIEENKLQQIILIFIGGMLFGEIFAGYIADVFGRRPTLLWSMAIFSAGTVFCFFSMSYEVLLIGRFLQGIGAAGQKISNRAIIRDLFSGNDMARLTSFVMATLVFVPFLAPLLGQATSASVGWRYIFVGLLAISLIGFLWAKARIPETLAPELKNRAGLKPAWQVLRSFVVNEKALGYTIIAGLMFGVHLAFLSLAPLLFRDILGIVDEFPIYFGGIACLFGIALCVNARFVTSIGAVPMSTASLAILVGIGIAALVVLEMPTAGGRFWTFIALMALTLSAIGILFGNIIALAMEPCRAVAGYGASISSGISTLVALGVSQTVGALYDGTGYGFFVVMAACSVISLVVMLRVRKSDVTPIRY